MKVSRPSGGQRPIVKHSQGGFTIVETLIVLAIAGFILLIVFEVIPVLERNSRNDQRKQDVQTILAAVSHYELNDSGSFPLNCGSASPACTSGDTHTPCTNLTTATDPNDHFLQCVANKLTYYTDSNTSDPRQVILTNLQFNAAGVIPQPVPNVVHDVDTVYVYNYQKCDPTSGGSISTGAGYADVVALYALESGNGTTSSQCQEL